MNTKNESKKISTLRNNQLQEYVLFYILESKRANKFLKKTKSNPIY